MQTILDAAELVVAGWKAGRIVSHDDGEDVPDGGICLARLAEALERV